MKINVTKTYLPPIEEYVEYLKEIWSTSQLTNNGPLLQRLEGRLKKFLGVKNFLYTTNGTIPLQIAIKALGIKKKIITTPFTYVATLNSILWEGCEPVFVDIDKNSLCIDANKIEQGIDKDVEAIMAVHVYGNPCDIDKIGTIAREYNLKIIYDAAHAFGVNFRKKSILDYGDVSTLSFHATKVFHSAEGGALVTPSDLIHKKSFLMRQFGHVVDSYKSIGINAKNSELHSAMGLCVLDHISEIINSRKAVAAKYDALLSSKISKPVFSKYASRNYAYYPVILKNEIALIKAISTLNESEIFPRRYFFPSLNTMNFLRNTQDCPVSEDIASRVLCLPLFHGLENDHVEQICEVINRVVNRLS